MIVRKMQLPGWYPQDAAGCRRMVDGFLQDATLPADLPSSPVAGIAPHAGWVFSGPVAAHTYKALSTREQPPDTVVVFGAGHSRVSYPRRPAVFAEGAWDTPLGTLPIDDRLAGRLLAATDLAEENSGAHDQDNTIEIHTPFIKHLWPDARLLPITMGRFRPAGELGRILARLLSDSGTSAVLVGSTDLTHYGRDYYGWAPQGTGDAAHEWSKQNDRRFIEKVLAMADDELVDEAQDRHNACGGSAVAATVAAAAALGAAKGHLLVHTTSHEVQPDGRTAANFVGYAAIVFA
jgi:AmmeMemoRadiSam system protein B